MISLIYPVGNAVVTQGFGENPADYACFGQAGHNGLDFGVGIGTPVKAAADGVFLRYGVDSTGYGKYVMIQHEGGWVTLYGHLSRAVSFHEVRAGDVIGYSGCTGNSTGPHLHFELRSPVKQAGYPQNAVDPSAYFVAVEKPEADPGPVRQADGEKPRVQVSSLNLRLKPSRKALTVGSLCKGTPVDVAGEPVEEGGITWLPVRLWVAAGLDGERYVK